MNQTYNVMKGNDVFDTLAQSNESSVFSLTSDNMATKNHQNNFLDLNLKFGDQSSVWASNS